MKIFGLELSRILDGFLLYKGLALEWKNVYVTYLLIIDRPLLAIIR